MNFTFGFITVASENEHHLGWRDKILYTLDSIRRQNIPNYEIIVVGGPYPKNGRNAYKMYAYGDVKHIPFDDEKDWISDDEYKNLKSGIKINDRDNKGESFEIGKTPEGRRIFPGIKNGNVSRKKNLIWQIAKYENVIIFHDYYLL